jgi:hypothetical protein
LICAFTWLGFFGLQGYLPYQIKTGIPDTTCFTGCNKLTAADLEDLECGVELPAEDDCDEMEYTEEDALDEDGDVMSHSEALKHHVLRQELIYFKVLYFQCDVYAISDIS